MTDYKIAKKYDVIYDLVQKKDCTKSEQAQAAHESPGSLNAFWQLHFHRLQLNQWVACSPNQYLWRTTIPTHLLLQMCFLFTNRNTTEVGGGGVT
jgi:hypothetical protein